MTATKRSEAGVRDPHFLTIDGVRVGYSDYGSGPVLLGLHATAHGGGDFASVKSELMKNHRLIVLDWPGHGSSEADHLPFSAARCAQIASALIEALDLRDVTIIGNSIGGAAALLIAAAMPQRISAVVACNPGGLAPLGAFERSFCRVLAALGRRGARGAFWYRTFFTALCRMVLQTRNAAPQRARIARSAYEVAKPFSQAWQSFAEPNSDIRALGPLVRQPVLFAWATRDAFVPLEPSREAIAAFPNAHLATFAAGHCAYLEQPRAFLDRFAEFERSQARRVLMAQ